MLGRLCVWQVKGAGELTGGRSSLCTWWPPRGGGPACSWWTDSGCSWAWLASRRGKWPRSATGNRYKHSSGLQWPRAPPGDAGWGRGLPVSGTASKQQAASSEHTHLSNQPTNDTHYSTLMPHTNGLFESNNGCLALLCTDRLSESALVACSSLQWRRATVPSPPHTGLRAHCPVPLPPQRHWCMIFTIHVFIGFTLLAAALPYKEADFTIIHRFVA